MLLSGYEMTTREIPPHCYKIQVSKSCLCNCKLAATSLRLTGLFFRFAASAHLSSKYCWGVFLSHVSSVCMCVCVSEGCMNPTKTEDAHTCCRWAHAEHRATYAGTTHSFNAHIQHADYWSATMETKCLPNGGYEQQTRGRIRGRSVWYYELIPYYLAMINQDTRIEALLTVCMHLIWFYLKLHIVLTVSIKTFVDKNIYVYFAADFREYR